MMIVKTIETVKRIIAFSRKIQDTMYIIYLIYMQNSRSSMEYHEVEILTKSSFSSVTLHNLRYYIVAYVYGIEID